MRLNKLVRLLTMMTLIMGLGSFCVSGALGATVATCAAATGGPAPGNSVFPVDCTGDTSGTLLASMSTPFSYTSAAGTTTGILNAAVYNDGGTLDFYYQVINDPGSSDTIERETNSSFQTFTTNAAFRTDGASLGTVFVDGSQTPISADSDPNGKVIGFSFYPPVGTNDIAPGQASSVLIISTNATNFTVGTSSVIDGGVASVSTFEPTAASTVPEPATLALLGFGLIGLAGVRRFRRG